MPRGNGKGPVPGRGQGRKGGLSVAGPGGNCVCPKCGHKESHIVKEPCNQKICSKCGAQMTRE